MEDRARPLDVDGLPGGTAAPQAVTEQPDLAFEHHPGSKWLGDVLGLRLLAVGLTWRLRRRDGRAPAVPWGPLVATAALAATAAGLLALALARLLA